MPLQLPSQILWGTGFENVLDFDYPQLFDSLRHWRRPAPGSERARNAAGTTDSAIYGYDYLLAGRARWFDRASWSDPAAGLQPFLDYAGQGNAFRFVPDKGAPDFYVDGCVLDQPFDDPAPDLEEADGSQAIDLVLRNSTVDFGQALRGLMFEYSPGTDITQPVAATFTRATAATYRGLPGNLAASVGASAASGVLRDRHYEGAMRTTLLEAARTQLVTQPENFAHADWVQENAPTLTAGQADPFGGTAAYLLNDDSALQEAIFSVVSLTVTAEKSVALFLRQGTSSVNMFGIWDQTAGAWRHRVNVTWTAGVPALTTEAGAGTRFPVENWGGGWWRCMISFTPINDTNVHRFYIYPTDNVSASTGTVYFFGANAWNAPFPSSYQGPSLGTRNADRFEWPYTHKPQPLFVLLDFVERGSLLMPSTDTPVIFGISNDAGVSPQVIIYRAVGETGYRVYAAVNTTAARQVVFTGAAPAFGDRCEILLLLHPDGSVEGKQSINGGADQTATRTASNLPFAAAWAGTKLQFNQQGGLFVGFLPLIRNKVGPLTFGGVMRDTIAKVRIV